MVQNETVFRKLNRLYRSPLDVQKKLRRLSYNREETLKSALKTWQTRSAHCFEAAFWAAAVLEHSGYPPLVVSIESIDHLDHVLFVFQHDNKWGSIGRSRDEGLHGRKPVFKSIRDLVTSYADPYVDATGRITGYALFDLRNSRAPWKYSARNVWLAERELNELKHAKFKMSEGAYQKARKIYQTTGHKRQSSWW